MGWLLWIMNTLHENDMDIPIIHISDREIKHPILEGLGLGLLFGLVPIIFSAILITILDSI